MPADLTREATLPPVLEGVGVVFHAAHLSDSSIPWERLYRVNVLGTDHLLEAARRAGVSRVVSWSSCRVYGRSTGRGNPVEENQPVRPREALGRSRAMQDAVVWRHHDAGLAATVLRPSLLYGAGGPGDFAEFLLGLHRLPFVPVPVNRVRKVASVHVKDVVRAASFLALREEAAGQEYNVSDEGRYSFSGFLRLLARALGKPTVPVLAPRALVKAGCWLAAGISGGSAPAGRGGPGRGKEMVYDLVFDFVPSNSKIKALDFRFLFPDPGTGIPETVQELRREGYLK
jgi:nucleoside-diphosphate-sugar epimerase